jgi:hypothetical protein
MAILLIERLDPGRPYEPARETAWVLAVFKKLEIRAIA